MWQASGLSLRAGRDRLGGTQRNKTGAYAHWGEDVRKNGKT